MSPKESYILESGFEEIADIGVRSFTIDSFSKRIGMSKKTIYTLFSTKENLVREIIHFMFRRINSIFKDVMKHEKNPAVQFIKIMETIAKFSGRTKIHRLSELKNWYPDIWKELEIFRLSQMDKFLVILKNAKEQGLTRDDIKMKSASIVYVNIINAIFQPEFFLKYDLPIKKTIRGFVEVVARGIFIDRGLKAIKKYHDKNSI